MRGVRSAALPAHHRVPVVRVVGLDLGPVDPRGVVYSYSEVRHAIQPAFRAHLPYLLLLVELDTQRGQPTADEALRLNGNLVTADGKLAPPELVRAVGIGTRVRMVFTPVAPGLALPQWTWTSRPSSRLARGAIRNNNKNGLEDRGRS